MSKIKQIRVSDDCHKRLKIKSAQMETTITKLIEMMCQQLFQLETSPANNKPDKIFKE